MKHITHIRSSLIASLALLTCTGLAPLRAADSPSTKSLGKLIFSDDFNREDGSKDKDAIGNGWSTASDQRAAGNKQVALKNGAMYIYIHPVADHAVSVRHDVEFKDGAVELRFMLEDEKDTLGVDFADLQCKEVHAGHLFKVVVGTKKVDVDDSKSGVMNLKFEEAKKAKTLTPEQQKFIASTKKSFPVSLEAGKWHGLLIEVAGETISVAVDARTLAPSVPRASRTRPSG
ncbi:MAG: hypothetical protein ABI318_07265 [Chthoniobacteraceae bacterium]